METFHKEFIRRIKRNIVNDPSIFTEKEEEEPVEQERLADESDKDMSIQSKLISFFRNNNNDGIFSDYLQKVDGILPSSELIQPPVAHTVIPSSQPISIPQPVIATVTQPVNPQTAIISTSSSTGQQPSTSSTGQQPSTSSTGQQPSTSSTGQQPPLQMSPVSQAARNVIDNVPTWIKNIYDKYQDKLLPITVPANNIDRAAREMLFNEIILWVRYALDEENIIFPHDLRELGDVIIPPSSN